MRLANLAKLPALLIATAAPAAEPPIAVRYWGGDTVSIESWWHGPVAIGGDVQIGGLAELGVVTVKDYLPRTNLLLLPLADDGVTPTGADLDSLLLRPANADAAALCSAKELDKPPPYSVHVKMDSSWASDSEQGRLGPILISVDGVRVLYWKTQRGSHLTAAGLKMLGGVDVLVLPIDQSEGSARQIVSQLRPRIVIPVSSSAEELQAAIETVPDNVEIQRVAHNSLAVPTADRAGDASTRVVVLSPEPWQPTGEVAELMQNMEAACLASQEVFRPLSANQMNFRPANGTHTPRWNPEHMMGRQLLFFSQIYSALDPAHQPIDLNPAQMPPDYRAAHPDWTGAEEARQMQRAADYVRRFAYLLEGVPLEEQAPGSRWTLRGLLEQMARHFGEHTANVQEKFELPGWPAR